MKELSDDRSGVDRRRALGRIGALGAAGGALALGGSAAASGEDVERDDDGGPEPFAGMWDVTVSGFTTYHYVYAVSGRGFVATGNIDANWDGKGGSFGPTMGTAERVGPRTYRIREKAWSFDPQGAPAGHSTFVGTYTLAPSGRTLAGEGTWTLYDLNGEVVLAEPLAVTGTRI